MNKNSKGISLIVSVITIIVIIILAAAVILTLTGNNPIEQAKKARFLNDMSEIKSAIGLQITDKFTNNHEYKIEEFDESDITKILDKTDEYKGLLEVQDGILVDVKLDEPEKTWFKELGVGGSGSVTPPEKPDTDIEKPIDGMLYKDSEGNYAPIPNGFIVSTVAGENTVNGGLVIKEGNDGASTILNEFVWVPVPDITEIYDESTKRGKLYDFEANRVSKMKRDCLTTTNEYREPAYLTDNTFADASSNNTVGITQAVLQNEFDAMIESVKKYKGFYIGRYETGDLSKSTVVVKKGNIDISNQSWYTMYSMAKSMISNNYVQSGIIWGCEWDATLRWMNKYEDTGNYVKDSTGRGNFMAETFSYIDIDGSQKVKPLNIGIKIPTGSAQISKVKNIYDMAGNVSERTMEGNSNLYRSIRASNYDVGRSATGNIRTAPTIVDEKYGLRVSLYIKY